MTTDAERAVRGAGWVYAYRWGDRLFGFVSLVVLARILLPDDFGVVAIAASFVAVVEGLSEFDVKNALIQSRDASRDLYDTAWTLSLARGVLSALALVGVAPLAGDPRITSIVLVLAVSPLLDGVSNPRFVMFERELAYSRLAAQTLAASLASTSVTLYVAIVYRSYWALVLGIVTGSLVRMLGSYALSPYRPRFTLARGGSILRFSAWMSLATIVSTLAVRSDRIILGRLLGIAETGTYYMTQRIGVLPTSELTGPLQRVLFPTFSRIAGDRVRLRRAVRESINVVGTVSISASVGFALVAGDFVPIVLGETWSGIVPLLVVLVPVLGLRAASFCARACVMALGRTRLMFRASLVYALVHLPVFVLGTLAGGLPGAIWAVAASGLFYAYLNFRLIGWTVGIPLSEAFGQLVRPLLASAIMVAVLFVADAWLPVDLFPEGGSVVALVVKVVAGAGVFALASLAFWRGSGEPAGFERRVLEAVGSRSR